MPKYSLTNMMRRAARAKKYNMYRWKPGPTDRKVTPSMSNRQRLPTADRGSHMVASRKRAGARAFMSNKHRLPTADRGSNMVTKRRRAGAIGGMKSWYPGKRVKK